MKKILSELQKYLEEVAGLIVEFHEVPEVDMKLPVFIRQRYTVYRGAMFDRECLLLLWKGRRKPTPLEISKQAAAVQSVLGADIVFIFPELEAYKRKRLIQYRIPFIVPRRQIYLPMNLIDLRDPSGGRLPVFDDFGELLSAPAQLLLLYHLQKEPGEDWHLSRWAEQLQYSAMTMSRACSELAVADLCEPVKHGRRILLRFTSGRSRLWELAQPHLRSPVLRRTPALLRQEERMSVLETGLTALSRFTRISADRHAEFAMSNPRYRLARRNEWLEERQFLEDGLVVIEQWSYSPSLLAMDNRTVDRLSLYLSMRDDPDERVQAALHELIEDAEW